MKRLNHWALLSPLFGASLLAQAADFGETTSDPLSLLGARSAGRGGAAAASLSSHDSLFLNPAAMAAVPRYNLNAGYLGQGGGLTASVVDSKSGPVAGGMFYVRRDLKEVPDDTFSMGPYSRIEERAGFGLAIKTGDNLTLGTNVKWGYVDSYTPGVGNAKNWNFDVGARFTVSPQIVIGIVGQNLMSDDTGLHPKNIVGAVEGSPTAGLVLSAQVSKLVVDHVDKSVSWALGGEYFFAQGIAARAGYSDSGPWDFAMWSLGGGYETESFSLDYAFQASIDGGDGQAHSFQVSGYF